MDNNITELKTYFTSVIDWIGSVFTKPESEMRGLQWGRLYETYHSQAYDPAKVSAKVQQLMADDFVKDSKGIFEYILGGCTDPKLLNIRVFDDRIKKVVYTKQTNLAKQQDKSNCPLCAIGHDANKKRIWDLKDMDADHVKAWSTGGSTDESNCQIPQFYNAIHAYSDTLKGQSVRDIFYNNGSLYDWEIAVRTNMGGGLPVIGFYEMKQDVYDTARRLNAQDITKQHQRDFCSKYIPVLQMIESDPDLKEACRNHSVYKADDKHKSLIGYLYHQFMEEAYQRDIVVHNYQELVKSAGMNDKVAESTEEDLKALSVEQLLGCIAWHFRRDHFVNGSLINSSIAEGHMLRMLKIYAEKEAY